MSKTVENFKKRKAEAEAEQARLEQELSGLKAEYTNYENQINDAIDSGNLSIVEKLTAKQAEVEIKIKATQKIIDRKASMIVLSVDEIAEAANADTVDYQKRIDKAQSAAINAKKEYLKKLLDVASLVNEAWESRTAFISLIDGIEDPTSINAQTGDFDFVKTQIDWDRKDNDVLKEINPISLDIMSNATRDRFNSYAGRNHTPRETGVVINK